MAQCATLLSIFWPVYCRLFLVKLYIVLRPDIIVMFPFLITSLDFGVWLEQKQEDGVFYFLCKMASQYSTANAVIILAPSLMISSPSNMGYQKL